MYAEKEEKMHGSSPRERRPFSKLTLAGRGKKNHYPQSSPRITKGILVLAQDSFFNG